MFMLLVYVTFSLFFKIRLTKFLSSEKSFSEELASYWLLTLYITRFSRWKYAAFTGMALCKLVKRNYGGKPPVSIKYQNLHSFKDRVIFLCQSILKWGEYHIFMAQLSLQSLLIKTDCNLWISKCCKLLSCSWRMPFWQSGLYKIKPSLSHIFWKFQWSNSFL